MDTLPNEEKLPWACLGFGPKCVCRWQSSFSSSSNVGLLLQTLEVLLSWARK